LASKTHGRLDRLTSQARSGRGHVSHRARHASGDAPWHASAKHSILEACFFRITPFRSMLLTLQKQLPLNSRRNSLPVKRIDGSRLMCHEYATRALVELMQSGHTPSGADPVLQHAPQACKRIAVVTTVGWPARPPQRLVPVCTCRRALLRPVEATAVGADDSLLAGVAQAGHHWMEILPPPLRLQMGDALGEDCGGALRDRAHATAPPPGGDPAPGARAAPRLAFAALVACARTRAQGSGGPASALGVAPPARPGQGQTPEAGVICREQHDRTAAGPGRAGRACERRPRARSGVGSAPARGPAGAAVFFSRAAKSA
jgi:hypothetical protein